MFSSPHPAVAGPGQPAPVASPRPAGTGRASRKGSFSSVNCHLCPVAWFACLVCLFSFSDLVFVFPPFMVHLQGGRMHPGQCILPISTTWVCFLFSSPSTKTVVVSFNIDNSLISLIKSCRLEQFFCFFFFSMRCCR